MQKFKQQHNRSRFDKYILNVPRSPHSNLLAQNHQSSFKDPIVPKEHTAPHQNQLDLSTLN
jgi:1-acyl-sn-glycerol-3-phosphate acyltransferase